MDPLAELEFDQSGFNYVGNNPLLFIDPTGMKRKKIDEDTYEETTPFDEVTVTAKRLGSTTSSYSMIELAQMSYDRNRKYHNGVASPYRKHFQDGGAIAVVGVGAAVGAGMLASVPVVANGISAGASYVANLNYASAGRWLLRKSFDMKGAKALWKSKVALSLTAQGVSSALTDSPLTIDLADVAADVVSTPFVGALVSSQLDITLGKYGFNSQLGNVNGTGVSDFSFGLASNISEGLIGKYGGKALGGISESKNYFLQVYQKVYSQMLNDTFKKEINKK